MDKVDYVEWMVPIAQEIKRVLKITGSFVLNNRIALGVDDLERADRALKGVRGKRLTYETTRSSWASEPPF